VTIEGEIIVRLERDERRVRRVTVRSTRPHAASRVVLGKAPQDAMAMVPSLFSICAHAQGAASASAIEAAEGRSASAEARASRETAVVLEMVQEYLWRTLVDWPQAQGQPSELEPVARVRRLMAPVLSQLATRARSPGGDVSTSAGRVPEPAIAAIAEVATQRIYGVAPVEWLALGSHEAVTAWAGRGTTLPARLIDELVARSPAFGRSEVALMPSPDRDALLAAVVPAMRSDPSFDRAPTWAGIPVETGALAWTRAHPVVAAFLAVHGNAVLTRFVARLTELAALIVRLDKPQADDGATQGLRSAATRDALHRVAAFPLGVGEGLAAVETARGLLLHRARVTDGRVAEYRIVAPTEWNFHPQGALARGLEDALVGSDAALARDAGLLVQALDPCVACRVEVACA